MKKLLSLLFVLVLLAPSVLGAYAMHTVSGDLQSFGRGIQALVPPGTNMAGFINGMLGSMPLFGLIVIVFGLMFFITKVTIFKSPDHDRYARMISFGVALMGLAQQHVYNTILNLSTTFLILAFMVAIVFMFIMFVNHNRKAHLTSHAELHKITGTALSSRRDLEKIKHELKHEAALHNKTETDLATLDNDLNSISQLVGNELSQVDKIAGMLRKAAAAHNSGNSPATNQYVQALTTDMAGLVTTMQHEQKHEHHLNNMVSKIESELAKWGHDSDKGKSEEEHIKHMFYKLSRTWGHEIKSEELTKLYKAEHKLIKRLKTMRNHLHNLQVFYDKIMGDTEDLEKSSYERKHLEANAVRDNIMNQQFSEAHKHLDNLRAIIEYEPHVISRFNRHETELRSLISKIHEEERELNQLIKNRVLTSLNDIRRSARANKTAKDNANSAKLSYANSLDTQLSLVLTKLSGIINSADGVILHVEKDINQNSYGTQVVQTVLSEFIDPVTNIKKSELSPVYNRLTDLLGTLNDDLVNNYKPAREKFLEFIKDLMRTNTGLNRRIVNISGTVRIYDFGTFDEFKDLLNKFSVTLVTVNNKISADINADT